MTQRDTVAVRIPRVGGELAARLDHSAGLLEATFELRKFVRAHAKGQQERATAHAIDAACRLGAAFDHEERAFYVEPDRKQAVLVVTSALFAETEGFAIEPGQPLHVAAGVMVMVSPLS